MPVYSQVTYVGDGVTQSFTVPFDYLERSHVTVTVAGTPVTNFQWTNSSTIYFDGVFAPIPAVGQSIVITRTTPRTYGSVVFSAGATPTSSADNNQTKFLLYVLQEILDASGFLSILPNPAGQNNKILQSDGTNYVFQTITALTNSTNTVLPVRNTTGSTITKGSAVYVSGFDAGTGRPLVSLADADDSTKMPAIGLVVADIATSNNGDVTVGGYINNLNTGSFAVGDVLCVGTVAGSLVTRASLAADKYLHANIKLQEIGIVTKVDGSAGQVHVLTVPDKDSTVGAKSTHLEVRNQTGGSLAAHRAVYISGFDAGTNRPLVALADYTNTAKMPAIGFTTDSSNNNTNTLIITQGTVYGYDTTGLSTGALLYVTSTGTLTATETFLPGQVQPFAVVLSGGVVSGAIYILGAINPLPGDVPTTKIAVYNNTGSTINARVPVYVSSYNTTEDVAEITPANNTSASAMPAIGLTTASILTGSRGEIVTSGLVYNVDTSAFSLNDTLYCGNATLVSTAPTGTAETQPLARVIYVHATEGVLLINPAPDSLETFINPLKLFTSSGNAIGNATGNVSIAHGPGGVPTTITAHLVNAIAEAGFSVGDEIPISHEATNAAIGLTFGGDATNLFYRCANAAQPITLKNKTTGAAVLATNANWTLKLRAWR